MYAHLCWENDDVNLRILTILIDELCNDNTTFVTVIKFTPMMEKFSQMRDRLSESRMEYLLSNLFERTFVKEYKIYIKYSDSLLNMILALVNSNYDA
mmetsp:Transcript_37553/g.43155  ORF Transcript_37553/g.43155 Transcript_37553/m.43155 type:complete len:97 (-) Transcript_37553:182-472(-)